MKKNYIQPELHTIKIKTAGFLAFSNPDADTLRGGSKGNAGTEVEQLGREFDFTEE